MARNWDFLAPDTFVFGCVVVEVNGCPDVSIRLDLSEIRQFAKRAYLNDPFALVYVFDDDQRWFKGEYSYANEWHNFTRVAVASVPAIIQMTHMVKP